MYLCYENSVWNGGAGIVTESKLQNFIVGGLCSFSGGRHLAP